MKCISPINIETPKGRKNVPCGRCAFCLVNKQKDWAFRLNQEMKVSESAHFVTLTYDEECLPFGETDPTLDKRDTQLFIKQLRNHTRAHFKQALKRMPKNILKQFNETEIKAIRYYLIGEYGPETNRPHYHAILFNVLPEVMTKLDIIWDRGHVSVAPVNQARINYVTKYLISSKVGDQERWTGKQKDFATMSRKPGIGANYIIGKEQYHTDTRKTQIRTNDGKTQRMPEYYKQKLFTEAEREDMAQKSLVLQTKRNNKERKRLVSLGNDPEIYQFRQQQIAINKINKTGKNHKL